MCSFQVLKWKIQTKLFFSNLNFWHDFKMFLKFKLAMENFVSSVWNVIFLKFPSFLLFWKFCWNLQFLQFKIFQIWVVVGIRRKSGNVFTRLPIPGFQIQMQLLGIRLVLQLEWPHWPLLLFMLYLAEDIILCIFDSWNI